MGRDRKHRYYDVEFSDKVRDLPFEILVLRVGTLLRDLAKVVAWNEKHYVVTAGPMTGRFTMTSMPSPQAMPSNWPTTIPMQGPVTITTTPSPLRRIVRLKVLGNRITRMRESVRLIDRSALVAEVWHHFDLEDLP